MCGRGRGRRHGAPPSAGSTTTSRANADVVGPAAQGCVRGGLLPKGVDVQRERDALPRLVWPRVGPEAWRPTLGGEHNNIAGQR